MAKKKSGKSSAVRRRNSAASLLIEREKHTPAEQIALLNSRLGANEGAKKERARLAGQLEKVKQK